MAEHFIHSYTMARSPSDVAVHTCHEFPSTELALKLSGFGTIEEFIRDWATRAVSQPQTFIGSDKDIRRAQETGLFMCGSSDGPAIAVHRIDREDFLEQYRCHLHELIIGLLWANLLYTQNYGGEVTIVEGGTLGRDVFGLLFDSEGVAESIEEVNCDSLQDSELEAVHMLMLQIETHEVRIAEELRQWIVKDGLREGREASLEKLTIVIEGDGITASAPDPAR